MAFLVALAVGLNVLVYFTFPRSLQGTITVAFVVLGPVAFSLFRKP